MGGGFSRSRDGTPGRLIEFLRQEIERGPDMIWNLEAGLDARPYRMKLPPSLLWVEAD
jgi:hypothetical protein